MPPGDTSLNLSLYPFVSFQQAAHRVLSFLQQRLGFSLWMVTRQEGEDWIVLVVVDSGYSIEDGHIFCWSDSFCSRMVRGLGPRMAPDVAQIQTYATAPINQQLNIGAYIGIPLYHPDGSIFGTICAIDPQPQPEPLWQELPLLELQAQLLSSLIAADLNNRQLSRHLEKAQQDAMTDSLTGLFNRRSWENLLTTEESQCQVYGSPAAIIVADLDDLKRINDSYGHAAGDALIIHAAQSLQQCVRAADWVARLGGDEFAILAVEIAAEVVPEVVQRIRQTLTEKGIAASIGWAIRHPRTSLQATMEQADRHMYQVKQYRKEQAPSQDSSIFCKILQDKHSL